MFYVYELDNSAVYKPAEGWYRVEEQTVSLCEDFTYMEDALERFDELVQEAIDSGSRMNGQDRTYGFKTLEGGGTVLCMPWATFNIDEYIGSGYSIEISVEKPSNSKYGGYR